VKSSLSFFWKRENKMEKKVILFPSQIRPKRAQNRRKLRRKKAWKHKHIFTLDFISWQPFLLLHQETAPFFFWWGPAWNFISPFKKTAASEAQRKFNKPPPKAMPLRNMCIHFKCFSNIRRALHSLLSVFSRSRLQRLEHTNINCGGLLRAIKWQWHFMEKVSGRTICGRHTRLSVEPLTKKNRCNARISSLHLFFSS